jgi:phytoene desaturase
VHKIAEAMARVATEDGAVIHLDSPVKRVITQGSTTTGIELSSGEIVEAHHVIMNADFAHGMLNLFDDKGRKSFTEKNINKKGYSCSTFMLYIGLDKVYDMPHHNIFFSSDYKTNVDQIFHDKKIPDEPSFYIQNASVTDPSLAPKGASAIYVLVPMPNLSHADIDWNKEAKPLRDRIMQLIRERTEMKDIESHIVVERMITPLQWQEEMSVHHGAVFNLAHSLDQMLYLRPHNRLNGYDNVYLVGGGTHPGSGLPTIVESGRIAAELISKAD